MSEELLSGGFKDDNSGVTTILFFFVHVNLIFSFSVQY